MTTKKSIDIIMLGPEPTPSGPFYHEKDIRLTKFFNWYNYFFSVSDARGWVVEWMRDNNYSKQAITNFQKLPDNRIPMSVCSLARMANNGAVFNEVLLNKIRSCVETRIPVVKSTKIVDSNAISIADRTKEKAGEILADIDGKLDDFYNNQYAATEFSMYDYLRVAQIKKVYEKYIIDYYTPLLNELSVAISGKDKDVSEGYSRLAKKQLTAYHAFVKMIVNDSERYFNNQSVKVVRKPKVVAAKPKKAVSIDNFKYMKEFNELKIVSFQPVTINDASSIWIYNVKTKKLSVLYAEDGKKLAIKGSSVINVDTTKSISKTLRNPADTIQKVLSGTKPSLKKLMATLSTKESAATGRSNEDLILLRCIK